MKKASKQPSRADMLTMMQKDFLRGLLEPAVEGLSAKKAEILAYEFQHGATIQVELRGKNIAVKKGQFRCEVSGIRWRVFRAAKPQADGAMTKANLDHARRLIASVKKDEAAVLRAQRTKKA